MDVVKQMADLLKSLDDDGKRRALWYLADLAGLSQRTAAQAPQQMHPQMRPIHGAGGVQMPRPAVPQEPAK